MQENHYYPYGALMGESTDILAANGAGSSDTNPYKFGGKELLAAQNANLGDYPARLLDFSSNTWAQSDPCCEDYAPTSPYVDCLGNPISLVDPDGKNPTEYEAALMAYVVYTKNLSIKDLPKDLIDSNWTLSSFNTSITMCLTNWYQNGLQSALFERTINGVTEYAYVFAGTNSPEDCLEDLALLIGLSPQVNYAIQNARTLSDELKERELTFIGHSLGGAEAAAASMATGRNAITFNAAPLNALTKYTNNLGESDNILNYRISAPGTHRVRFGGCFISNFLYNSFGMRAEGKMIRIIAKDHNPYTAHGIVNFINHFKNNQDYDS